MVVRERRLSDLWVMLRAGLELSFGPFQLHLQAYARSVPEPAERPSAAIFQGVRFLGRLFSLLDALRADPTAPPHRGDSGLLLEDGPFQTIRGRIGDHLCVERAFLGRRVRRSGICHDGPRAVAGEVDLAADADAASVMGAPKRRAETSAEKFLLFRLAGASMQCSSTRERFPRSCG